MDKQPKFKRRAEARPDEVLDAALEMFLEKGFAAAKVEDVARRAGVSKGLVYLYFPSKDALLEAIVRRAISPVADSALAQLAVVEGDPRVALRRVIGALMVQLSDPQRMAIPKLILREAWQFPKVAEMYRREVLDRAIPAVTALLQRGMDQGYLRQLDAELTVRSLVGPIAVHLMLAEVFDIAPGDGLALERFMDNHLAILFDGLSAHPMEHGQ
ncbi:TetR family transcriptional regulator [Devosia limi DSM 17137]|uniref:TetR family transcriptional regulator n=1 Tax=Devosia limi DSM 17137 TaxID=1121477 RepID=A0A0F5LRR0_9HYPH|nr:TetR/AcrR family transcriptional regulator [Devosia limi]KKB85035.1 TetR family transcriptional regulator [Devosia limi DSM 17137]SHF38395.1 transcriptional regulator, TetR family [Devosia limi DSM 17137]